MNEMKQEMKQGRRKKSGIRLGNIRLRPRFFAVLTVTVLCVAASIGGGLWLADRNRGPSEEAPYVEEIGGIPVIRDLLPEGIPGRPGTLRTIRYVVIHETGNEGNNAGAASHNNYIHAEAAETKVSWHYTVDDHEIYQHLPDNEVGFHAGDQLTENGGNMCGIGIEMCVNPESDYETTLNNAAALAARLMEAYDLPMKALKKHQDFSGKNCPQRLIEAGRWEEFCDMVLEQRKVQRTIVSAV